MFSFLKDHPFAVEAFFERSLVVTYAVPKEQVAKLIPECLELDTFDDRWGFIAVAMVNTKELRPNGFPRIFGSDFFLIGYRVFVRFTDSNGKRSRGLYILGSATDKRKMEFLGNIFTHYKYTTTDITRTENDGFADVHSNASGIKLLYEDPNGSDVPLPDGSPFADWKEARRFAGPLPFTFTHEPGSNQVLIVEGVRQNWTPLPVNVLEHQFTFIETLRLTDVRLANAFMVRNVPYYWKKGRVEPCTK
ncbi:MAG: DUF2071 domain-containing protein [Acidobacteriota bacterium]